MPVSDAARRAGLWVASVVKSGGPWWPPRRWSAGTLICAILLAVFIVLSAAAAALQLLLSATWGHQLDDVKDLLDRAHVDKVGVQYFERENAVQIDPQPWREVST